MTLIVANGLDTSRNSVALLIPPVSIALRSIRPGTVLIRGGPRAAPTVGMGTRPTVAIVLSTPSNLLS